MTDTIFAIATAAGQSAIAIFRLSGPLAYEIGDRLSGKNLPHRQLTPCLICDEDGGVLDDVMMVFLAGPATPTGEDMIEIHCHGSLSVLNAITSYLARQDGVRSAQPGEFTKRAFDNGKMDLTEVEGLADLIEAQTEQQRRQALDQLKGTMRKKAISWRQEIIALSGRVESLIDFSDEELPEGVLADIDQKRATLISELADALDDNKIGEIIRHGLHVALLGPVNAGKSTALNALAGRPAAIVSDEAGTTRDIVEVRLDIDGMAVILQDTAGIRDDAGHVETIGIERALAAAREADLVILLADGSQDGWYEMSESLAKHVTAPMIKLANKKDLMKDEPTSSDYLAVSLTNETDCMALEKSLATYCRPLIHSGRQPLITRHRHRQLVGKALHALSTSCEIGLDQAPELAAEEFRVAADALGQMTGHIDVEDILGDIFSSFCIGK